MPSALTRYHLEVMAAVDQITFRLERFGWAAADRLVLSGRWSGVGADALDSPVLVLRRADGDERIEALPVAKRLERDGRWMASFPWKEEYSDAAEVELELDRGLAVELPLPHAHQRRFGRPLLRARLTSPSPSRSPEGSEEDSPAGERSPSVSGDQSSLGLHAALIQAQDERDEARAQAEHVREEAQLARRDAERERERRRTEIERMRGALTTARALAEEELAAERAAFEQRLAGERASLDERVRVEHARLTTERDEIAARLVAEQNAAGELRDQLDQINNTLAVERLNRSRLHEELDALRADMDRATRREQALVERQASASAEGEMALAALRDEVTAVRQALSDSADEVARRDDEINGLRARLVEAEALAEDNRRLSEELEETRAHASEVGPLRARLADLVQRVDQVPALQARLAEAERRAEEIEPLRARLAETTDYARQVQPLRENLADARRAMEGAQAEVEVMRERLQAVRAALGE